MTVCYIYERDYTLVNHKLVSYDLLIYDLLNNDSLTQIPIELILNRLIQEKLEIDNRQLMPFAIGNRRFDRFPQDG